MLSSIVPEIAEAKGIRGYRIDIAFLGQVSRVDRSAGVRQAVAIIAALALVVRPRRWTALIAFLVSAGGFAAVLLYQYVNVGAIGPLPNMCDPVQYPEKTLSVSVEGIAAVAALALLALMHWRARGGRTTAATGAALNRGG